MGSTAEEVCDGLAVEQRHVGGCDEYGPGEVGRQPLEPTTDSVPGALLLVLNSDGDGTVQFPGDCVHGFGDTLTIVTDDGHQVRGIQ